jgi:hypothetical protein
MIALFGLEVSGLHEQFMGTRTPVDSSSTSENEIQDF